MIISLRVVHAFTSVVSISGASASSQVPSFYRPTVRSTSSQRFAGVIRNR